MHRPWVQPQNHIRKTNKQTNKKHMGGCAKVERLTITTFSIRDLRICGFWNLQGRGTGADPSQILKDTCNSSKAE
jgi:hypothetical protein